MVRGDGFGTATGEGVVAGGLAFAAGEGVVAAGVACCGICDVSAAGEGAAATGGACFGIGDVAAAGEGIAAAGAGCFGIGDVSAGDEWGVDLFAEGTGFGAGFREGAGGDVGWFASGGTARCAYAGGHGGGGGAAKVLCLGALLISFLRLRIKPDLGWLLAAVHLAGHAGSPSSPVDLRE